MRPTAEDTERARLEAWFERNRPLLARLLEGLPPTEFVGHDSLECGSRVLRVVDIPPDSWAACPGGIALRINGADVPISRFD